MKQFVPEIFCLCRDLEVKIGRQLKTPIDFKYLSEQIWESTHELLSSTTLKRLWGYIEGSEKPRRITLCVLTRFLGYQDWEDYLNYLDQLSEEDSAKFLGEGIATANLKEGRRLEVLWQPNRRCVFEYIGEGCFEVKEVEHSKLPVGTRCRTSCFLIGQLLYLDLTSGEVYVAGKKNGLTAVRIL